MAQMAEFEARQWLEENKANDSAFATNMFAVTENAVKFVEGLYAAGASMVLITNVYDEPWRIAEEGAAYADTLLVQLDQNFTVQTLAYFLMTDGKNPNEFSILTGGKARLWWD